NIDHGITPKTVFKSKEEIMKQSSILDIRDMDGNAYGSRKKMVAEPIVGEPTTTYDTAKSLEEQIKITQREMRRAAKKMDFMEAARLRDIMFNLEKQLQVKQTKS
ncbi:MAG TPA: UvrB/UvrC motif-containing protein, partial [Chitinophagales bacterium]|nr:UvrB/UvrC motif-containing protein [Chitinophagales bacterium]